MSDRVDMVAEEEEAGKVAAENNAAQEDQPQAEVDATAETQTTQSPSAADSATSGGDAAEEQSDAAGGDVQASSESAAGEPEAEGAAETVASSDPVEGQAGPVDSEPADADPANVASMSVTNSLESSSINEEQAQAMAESDPNVELLSGPDGTKRMVRVLSVGQQVEGVVKRIADFGAFMDIGVGRDGLIHISELSVRRVGKVTDVLSEGQQVTAWIKKLDRDRNRISLTLIDPNTKTIRDLEKDEIVQGTVTRIMPYGAFVDIGIGRDALLHVREMAQGYVAKPEDVVSVGEELEARIIELSRRRGRVDLSLKGLRPEPEAAQQPEAEQQEVPQADEEAEDQFEDVEVLSPMELAFKRAMEAEGMDVKPNATKPGKRNRRGGDQRSLQDEIIQRTLSSGSNS